MPELDAQETVQVDNTAEGSATEQTEINWSGVEIPDDIIMNHPAYKKLLSESVKRKQKIQELKRTMPEATEQNDGGEEATSQQVDVGAITNAILEQIRPQLEQFQQVADTIAAKDQDVQARSLQTTYNLSKEDVAFMRDLPTDQWEKFAQRVGKKVEETQFGGDGGKPNKRNRFIERYQRDRGLMDDPNQFEAFSPETHERLSGGAVVDK